MNKSLGLFNVYEDMYIMVINQPWTLRNLRIKEYVRAEATVLMPDDYLEGSGH